MGKITDIVFKNLCEVLDKMKNDPDSVTQDDRNKLETLYAKLCKGLGISEHSQWRVQWKLEKWAETARKIAGFAPDEVLYDTQNIILDVGATELLSIISGTGGTPYNAANSYIYVGTDTTPESASQVGVIATGQNRAYAGMDSGYPIVNNRQVIYRASFGDSAANFEWNEAAIMNGTGPNAVAMNRKVTSLGKKVTGTWTLQITVTLTSA